QSRTLRAAQLLAAAVTHHRGAPLEVDVRYRQDLRGGVGQDWNILLPGDARDLFEGRRPGVGAGTGEDIDHRGPRPDAGLQLGGVLHLDDPGSDRADGRVVV